MKTWFYTTPSSTQAQAPEEALPDLVANGVLQPTTLVWCTGMPAWSRAAEALAHLFPTAPEVPPPIPGNTFLAPKRGTSHQIDYEIFGDDIQLVEIELDPGETVVAEAGAMCYMDSHIVFEAKMGDGSDPVGGIFGALKAVGKRFLTGESIFMTHFTHAGVGGKQRVAFAAPYPGKIVPLDLAQLGGEILCEKGAFLCAARGTSVGVAFNQKLGAGLFGGEGFILQRLKGDGMAFIHAGGTILRKELRGETLRVDTGCLVAMTPSVNYDIQRAGNLKSMLFGGEGLFLATLQGHGTVWLQSLPFSRIADRILASAPSAGGRSREEGSLLGGVGRLVGGD